MREVETRTALDLKLSAFTELSGEERLALAAFEKNALVRPAGANIVMQGDHGASAYVLMSGWACSYKILRDGGRQIVDFQIAGDFLGLRSVLLRTSDHAFQAVTDVRICAIPMDRLTEVIARYPRLLAAILWVASRDEAMVVEHLVSIGRRPALLRVAHFFLEMGIRSHLVSAGSIASYDCPLNQYQLGDALGLTSIHVNRMLRQLRDRKLMCFKDGRVNILDREGLKALADYDGEYLDMHRKPWLRPKN
jgi:CRP-like cAMP-binding protein